MPQLTLHANCIADVLMDENGGRIVKINANEEDFFAMLDSVNPKNLIKYLDMRKIAHRDALQINVKTIDGCLPPESRKTKRNRAIRGLYDAASRANKKLSRAYELQQVYGKKTNVNDYDSRRNADERLPLDALHAPTGRNARHEGNGPVATCQGCKADGDRVGVRQQ